ncbi:hypothetical protein [Mesosutterella porci]|uniref:hypothetical protein n=1 Tax=Mesosutterella porci TaxID=2915351 RepID=UPI001EDD14D4|nr:hypothetical protein [Mesosutterella sp. oilRF-744-WT-GAM-9]
MQKLRQIVAALAGLGMLIAIVFAPARAMSFIGYAFCAVFGLYYLIDFACTDLADAVRRIGDVWRGKA